MASHGLSWPFSSVDISNIIICTRFNQYLNLLLSKQALEAAVHYVVGRLADAEGDAKEVVFTPGFVAALGNLTTDYFGRP